MSRILDRLALIKEPVVLICKWMTDEALAEVIYNTKKGTIDVAVICLTGSDQIISDTLQDLSCLFNARLY